MSIRRILSIDGGGLKGMFPASFLATIEEDLDRPIGEYFDLIVGTSTGGIIALGLGLGFKAAELVDFYKTLGPKVFAGNKIIKLLRQVVRSKYDSAPLRNALEAKFGTYKLGDSKTRLVIPSLNLETYRVHIYKTPHHKNFTMDHKVPAVEVALATGSAPTYFPAFLSTTGIPLVDGGVWANNPISIAAVESIGVLGWDRANTQILSVGCTEELTQGNHFLNGGLAHWAWKTVDLFMSGQASGSLGMAEWLIGKKNIHRINPVVPMGRYGLDDIKGIQSLHGRGYDEARKAKPILEPIFFQSPAEKFVPLIGANAQSFG